MAIPPSSRLLSMVYEPVASVVPSGEKLTQIRGPLSMIERRMLPVAGSHSLSEKSRLPLARVRSSGEKATVQTSSACPFRTRKSSLVCASQTRISPDLPETPLPLASSFPSCE